MTIERTEHSSILVPVMNSPVRGAQTSNRPDDFGLIDRLQKRDPQAMVELYDRYGKLIFSIILRAVRSTPTAEDLTQETFLRVWNRIHTFSNERGNLQGWLVTVARNRAFDYLRSLQSSVNLATSNLDDVERAGHFCSEVDQSDRISKQNAVKTALNLLPEDQREVIELTHYEGMTQTEIAEKLGKPLGTVKGLVRGALKKLRNAMTEETVQ
jgi:RNA polymerase sigma-70 factor, ECF subfamily